MPTDDDAAQAAEGAASPPDPAATAGTTAAEFARAAEVAAAAAAAAAAGKPESASAAAAAAAAVTAATATAVAPSSAPAAEQAPLPTSAPKPGTATATGTATAPTAAASAGKGSTSAEKPAVEHDQLSHPLLALMVMALFVVATLVKLTLASGVFHTSPVGGPLIDSLAVGALMVGVSIWFIHCFTGDADRRIMDIFVFAYAFTIGAFAMLVLPFVGEQRQSASGAAPPSTMELVRGCVRRGSAGGLSEVSAVVLCPSGASADVPASAASWPAGQPTRYTLLLAVGGVTATVEEDQSVKLAAAAASAPPAAPAPEKPVAPAAEPPTHVEVVGGLALPFFVLVLSFIGGAVSLSRRIPEYQRRLHPQYTASPEESKMRPFEAREAVVFQIMQLVSAPFLSVATWYIVSPSGLASAATLAFGTGFASEPLLLMIRGMVKGIRPENAKFPQKADDPKPNPGLAPEALPPPAAPVDGAPGVPVAPPAAMPDPVEPPAPPELGPELGPISEHLLELPPAPGPITAPTGKT